MCVFVLRCRLNDLCVVCFNWTADEGERLASVVGVNLRNEPLKLIKVNLTRRLVFLH